MENRIKKVKDLMDEIETTWLADDGGLTMAASDALAFGHHCLNLLEQGINPFDTYSFEEYVELTTTEQDFIDLLG